MQQTTLSKLNTWLAWLVFTIAAIVYGLTVEPTASYGTVQNSLRVATNWKSDIHLVHPSSCWLPIYSHN